MRASLYLLSTVPLLSMAVFAGAFVAPNNREVALMHLRDLDFDTSFKSYTSLHAQGDTTAGVLVPLINLDLHYGKVEDAIGLLEAFVKDRPDNVEGRQWLANLYKAAQKPHEYCRMLEDLYRLRPSTATLRELADTYDFLGDYDREMMALVRLFGREDYMPREEDATALAIFYRADGNALAATTVMGRLLDAKGYAVSLDSVNLAVRLWLDMDNPAKAFAIGKTYLQKNPEEANALKLSEVFQSDGELDRAYEILLPFISSGNMSRQLEQQMVGVLLAQGKDDLVFNFLRSLFVDRRLPKELATTLVDLAEPRGDFVLVEDVLKNLDLNEVPEETLMRYADLSIRLHRSGLARFIEDGLSLDYLQNDAPVLAAVLRVAVEPLPENVARLAKEPAVEDAPIQARLTVARIFMMNEALEPAQRLVRQMGVTDALSELEAMEFAMLYLGDDATASEAKARLKQALAEELPPEVRQRAELATYLIDVGSGNPDAVNAYRASHVADQVKLDSDTYDVASHFHQDGLALEAARRIFSREPSRANADRLVDAFLAAKQYAGALDFLENDSDSQKLSTNIDVLALWAQAVPVGKERDEMQKHVEFILRRLEPRSKQMRDTAYVLQKAGFRMEAEKVLTTLAEGQPYASKDTQDLLAYWGINPSEAALGWVKLRAQQASGVEKGAWLNYLNAINKPQIVLELTKDGEGVTGPALESYIDALVLTRSAKLGDILAREVSGETDLARLKKLAFTAEQENVSYVAEKAWQKVFGLAPHDIPTLKRIALQEVRAGHFSKAKPLLQEYLQSEPDDYQANYAYAEVIRRNNKDAATPYYDKALVQALESEDEGSLPTRLTEANLVYRSRGFEESAMLFHKLLDQYPNDKSIRADFAEILLENKRYDDASMILAQ